MYNAILERIHQVLGKLVQTCNMTQTYIEKDDPWLGILSAAYFAVFSTTNRLKCYSLCQLVFFSDMILPIKNTVGRELIHKRN